MTTITMAQFDTMLKYLDMKPGDLGAALDKAEITVAVDRQPEWHAVYQDTPFAFTQPASMVVVSPTKVGAVIEALRHLIRAGCAPQITSLDRHPGLSDQESELVLEAFPHLRGNYTGRTRLMSVSPLTSS